MMKGSMFPKISAFLMVMIMIFTLGACGSNQQETKNMETENKMNESVESISGTEI